jgi:hypothetical protein
MSKNTLLKINSGILVLFLDILKNEKYILAVKSGFLKIFGFMLFVSVVMAGAYLDYFHARSEGENVKLEWKTGDETNLRHFVVQRRNPNSSFIDIATLPAKGSNSFYTYIDESAYKVTDLIFIYRLKIVDQNNQTSYSSEVSVTPNISGVKRTWGSIKAMFR